MLYAWYFIYKGGGLLKKVKYFDIQSDITRTVSLDMNLILIKSFKAIIGKLELEPKVG